MYVVKCEPVHDNCNFICFDIDVDNRRYKGINKRLVIILLLIILFLCFQCIMWIILMIYLFVMDINHILKKNLLQILQSIYHNK